MVRRVLGNIPSIRHVMLDAALDANQRSYGEGVLSEEKIAAIAKEKGGYWKLFGCLYSEKTNCEDQIQLVKSAFAHIEGSQFQLAEDAPPDSYIRHRINIFKGIPNLHEMKWINWLPNGAHLFFSPICPITASDAKQHFELVKKRHREYGFDCFSTFCVGPREMHHICKYTRLGILDSNQTAGCMVYDKNDDNSKRKARQLLRVLIDDAAKLGYGEYRTHLAMMDQVMGVYDFNNHAFLKMCETIKDAIDPSTFFLTADTA